MIKILIGVGVLFFGFFIGKFLAQITKEELKTGQKWFKLIVIFSGLGAIGSLIFLNDYLLFGFLFIMVVSSQSLKNRNI